jgi:hypothetical protein
MALRTSKRERAVGSRRAMLASTSIRGGTLGALLGAGLLAATALAASHSAQAEPQGSTTTSTTAGSPSTPKGGWMTFEANPVSFVLRPLRKFAACVRKHGVPSLADPKVVGGKVVLMLPRGLTAKSPRLLRARRACQKFLPQGANTQPGTGTGPTTTQPGSG